MKSAIFITAIFLVAWLGLKLAVDHYAFSQQRRAERVLAVFQTLQPGITSTAEVESQLRSLAPGFAGRCSNNLEYGVQYFNIPPWRIFENNHTPELLRNVESRWVLGKMTMFEAYAVCQGDRLTQVRLMEGQDSGWVHPYGAVVHILSNSAAAKDSIAGRSEGGDYETRDMATSTYEGDKLVATSPTLYRVIRVTQSATAIERQRAVSFHLGCFTHLCQSADQILSPVPNR